jgi:exosortase
MTANTMTPERSSAEKPAKTPLEELPGEFAQPSAGRLINWSAVRPIDVATLAVVTAVLGWAYAPNIASLVRTWNREPDYSHGFLVIPIALVILWKTWPTNPEAAPRLWFPGWLLVIMGLALRYLFHERGQAWSESATLLPVIAGLGLARMGWRSFLRTWPAFAFLIFLFPLPQQINTALSQPLQSLATWCACSLLRLTGLWVMPEGNVIMVGNERLEVAAACNGLSMLMSLAATVAATASLVPMANWKRLILLPSIIPIALGSNVLRITATAWCYHKFGAEVGSKYAHDAAGWLMMPTAMILVGLELAIMSWLIVESEESDLQENRLLLERTTSPAAFEGRL